MNSLMRFAVATLIIPIGYGVLSLGSAGRANADDPPWPFVGYHWCPGLPFDPAWGPQWDPATCHDAHHRDEDGTIHVNDYWGPSPFQTWPEIPNTRP